MWLVAGFGLAIPAGVAIAARTISHSGFAVAGRTIGVGENAIAGAVAGLGGVFAIAIAAAGWRTDQQLIALVLGLAGGCLLGGVLVVPYFRRSGSATPGDFLAARFGSRAVSAIAGLIAALALFPMLVAQLHVAAMIAALTLDIGSRAAIFAAAGLMILAPLLGGMRGITLSALVQFLFVLPALAATALWIADSVTGPPLSLIAYGLAGSDTPAGEIAPGLQAACADMARHRTGALHRARHRRVSTAAGARRNRPLGRVGAFVSRRGAIVHRDLRDVCDDDRRHRQARARRRGSEREDLRRIDRQGTLDCPLGSQGSDTGHDLRPAGTGQSRLRRPGARSRRSGGRCPHCAARRARHGRTAAARLDAARHRLPGAGAGRRLAGAVRHRRGGRARSLRPWRRAARAGLAPADGAAAGHAGGRRPCGLCRDRSARRRPASGLVVAVALSLRPVSGVLAGDLVAARQPLGGDGRAGRRICGRGLSRRGDLV